MSKNKSGQASKNAPRNQGGKAKAAAQATEPRENSGSTATRSSAMWIITGLIVVGLVVGVAIAGAKSGDEASGPGGPSGTPAPSAEEAKYIGRFLPDGYEEPAIDDGGEVSADTPMAQITATQDAKGVTIPVSELAAKRNVAFQYQKADGTPIPLIAYIKPSGKLFVGVSYCVPCKGTGQTLTTDGMLTCDSCGTKRDLETSTGISGACKLYPLDELPVTVGDGQISIPAAALDGWTVQPLDRQVG